MQNNKNQRVRFFLIVYCIIFFALIIKDKYIGSGKTFAMGKVLNWEEILNNIIWYLIFSFFGAILFLYADNKMRK